MFLIKTNQSALYNEILILKSCIKGNLSNSDKGITIKHNKFDKIYEFHVLQSA